MLKNARGISETVIRRMPVYHRYLKELIEDGIERVSSKELSGLTGFSASQIRQDLNNFGGFGQQGYGYNTKALKEQVDKILVRVGLWSVLAFFRIGRNCYSR